MLLEREVEHLPPRLLALERQDNQPDLPALAQAYPSVPFADFLADAGALADAAFGHLENELSSDERYQLLSTVEVAPRIQSVTRLLERSLRGLDAP